MMPVNLSLLLILLLSTVDICVIAQQQQDNNNNNDVGQSENNIAFDLPDLTATIDTLSGGQFQIEAYKSVNNDRILLNPGTTTQHGVSQLFWVSVGLPMFIKTPPPPAHQQATTARQNSTRPSETAKLFHFTRDGFYAYVQMLTPEQRRLLAFVANAKYPGVNVSEGQVVNLILSKFECSLLMYDNDDNKYLLKGKVTDFRNFPLRIDFKAPRISIERKLFAELLDEVATSDDQADLHFICQMASRGQLMRTNTLTISQRQLEHIGLVDKLFGQKVTTEDVDVGPVENVYVTRQQLTELAGEMYSTLNIVEDYQMPEAQFSEAFVNDLLTQVAVNHFTMVPVEAALESLSNYGFDLNTDLDAELLRSDLRSLLIVEKTADKSRIVLNESIYNSFQQYGDGKTTVFGLRTSAEWARSNSLTPTENSKPLNDQLRDLNMASYMDIKWAIDGNRVIPRTMNVARLRKSQLTRTLAFRRVKLQTISAAFEREFGLYTIRSIQTQPTAIVINQIRQQLVQLEAVMVRRHADQTKLLNDVENKTTASVQAALDLASRHETAASIQLQQLQASLQELRGQIVAVSSRPTGVRRCRVCFQETEGSSQCQGYRNSCSAWSDGPGWTLPFRDDTDGRAGGCHYQWKIECQ